MCVAGKDVEPGESLGGPDLLLIQGGEAQEASAEGRAHRQSLMVQGPWFPRELALLHLSKAAQAGQVQPRAATQHLEVCKDSQLEKTSV